MEQPLLSTSGGLGSTCLFQITAIAGGMSTDSVNADPTCDTDIFIGTVFSVLCRCEKEGDTDPREFVCVNAVFYEPKQKHCDDRASGTRPSTSSSMLKIGPSSMSFDGERLTVDLNERSAPFRRAIKGKVVVDMPAVTDRCYTLHSAGQHRWWPITPTARVKVSLDAPNVQWEGAGYVDTNGGTVPLEDTFTDWHWSRVIWGQRIAASFMRRTQETVRRVS